MNALVLSDGANKGCFEAVVNGTLLLSLIGAILVEYSLNTDYPYGMSLLKD